MERHQGRWSLFIGFIFCFLFLFIISIQELEEELADSVAESLDVFTLLLPSVLGPFLPMGVLVDIPLDDDNKKDKGEECRCIGWNE